MNKVYLLTGGNMGDRMANIRTARAHIINSIGKILLESSVYESEPWGFKAEQSFLNQVLLVETDLLPLELLEKCQQIENTMERVRASDQYISRTMDIDILFYNSEIIELPQLVIPHNRLHERKFTLEPLNEIAPDFVHPKLNKKVAELLLSCNDSSKVSIYTTF